MQENQNLNMQTAHDDFDWSVDKRNVAAYSQETRVQMEQAYDSTFKSIEESELISGVIVGVTKTDVIINIGFKSDGLISLNEFRDMSEIKVGDECSKGSQLRPHIVWFGEMVPLMDTANLMAEHADIFIVIGTSMAVYPAAGIIDYSPQQIPKYLIDPNDIKVKGIANLTIIKEKASIGLPKLASELLK